ncbi:histidine kinase [Lacibacter sp. MH-610]|uniref:sensor histidine kinase n=1 Tax=Lacibacter sp. MH-610 TaxID=3020883 RepID=UPI003891D88D
MRYIFITISNFAVLVFLLTQSRAQSFSNPFYTKLYTANDGLPDSYILNTYQDKRNYLWVGAYRGLSLFDGKNFHNYSFSNGMPDLYINNVIEDDEQRIWVTSRKGIGYIKNKTYYHTVQNDSMQVNYVFSFFVNPDKRFFALTSSGLYEWKKNVWEKRNWIKRFENMPVRTMVYDSGSFYIAYFNYFVKYYPDGTHKILDSNFKSSPQYLSIKKYGDDIILQQPTSLYRVKGEQLIPLFQNALKGLFVYTSLKDSQGRFWVSTEEEGLFVSQRGEEQKFAYKIPLPNNLVSGIYEDKENNVWLSNYQGLIKVKELFFKKFPPISTPMKEVKDFFLDGNNLLMTHSFANGFYTYRNNVFQKDVAHNYSYLKVLRKDGDTLLDFIIPAAKRTLWAITRGKKLVQINEKQTSVIDVKDSTGKKMRFYNAAYNPATETVIACSRVLFEIKNGTVTEFTATNKVKISDPVNAFVAGNGNIIVLNRKSEFFVIDKNRNVTEVTKDLDFNVFIPHIKYAESPDKSIWIAVPGLGMRQYQWQNDNHLKLLVSITSRQGLPNDVVTSMCFDKFQRLWASTLSGIVILESARQNTEGILPMILIDKKNFDLTVNINENFSRIVTDSLNRVWLSTGTELLLFYPEKFGTMLKAPVMNMEKVMLNLQETNWKKYSDSITGFFEIPLNPVLPYEMNNFIFNFKGVSFADEGEIFYSYKTEGADNIWSPPFTNSAITSIRFSPGTYTISIRAKKANSEWSTPVSFTFTIKQPWWNTWSFRIAGIIITSLVLTIIFRNQLKSIRKNAALQNLLRDLEMKALKAQMNPHFIYNALNSIQSLVMDRRNAEAQDYMVKFSRLLRQVLNHSEENVITLEKELSTLTLYIELEALRLNYSFQYFIHVEEHIVTENEWVPPLIIQPFVENALWHGISEKQGEKILTINIREEDSWIICEVIDNGVGRRQKNAGNTVFGKNGPRGIDITRARLAAYNNTKADNTFAITDLKDKTGKTAGTMVVLKFKR